MHSVCMNWQRLHGAAPPPAGGPRASSPALSHAPGALRWPRLRAQMLLQASAAPQRPAALAAAATRQAAALAPACPPHRRQAAAVCAVASPATGMV